MVRRLAPFVFSLSILLGAFAAPASADDAGVVSFTVPDNPSGDITVTATADPDAYPFLRVAVIDGVPFGPDPVPNPGGTTSLPFSTWGLHRSLTMALYGCQSADVTSCTQLATSAESFTQTAHFGATWNAPTAPFFWPDQRVTVTPYNDGGGTLEVEVPSADRPTPNGLVPTSLQKPVEPDITSDVDLSDVLVEAQSTTPQLLRCSPYAPADLLLCESQSGPNLPAFIASRVAINAWPTSPYLADGANGGWDPIATDTTLAPGTLTLFERGPSAFAYDASWSIVDGAGATVVGPVDVGAATASMKISVTPAAEPGGRLLDGSYTLIVKNSIADPGDGSTRTGTFTHPITLVADPPAEPTPTPMVTDRVVRNGPPGWDLPPDDAGFEVPAIDGAAGTATLIVRNAAGKIVDRRPYPSRDASVKTYFFSWDGYRHTGGQPLPAGTYTATASIPDQYGRQVVVPLGRIDDYSWANTRYRAATSVSAHLRVPRRGSTSRVFRLRLPANAGNVISVWPEVRAASRVHGKYRMAVRVPSLSPRWTTANEHLSTAETRPSWSSGPGWQNVGTHPIPAGRMVEVRVTVRHGRHVGAVDVSRVRLDIHGWRWSLT